MNNVGVDFLLRTSNKVEQNCPTTDIKIRPNCVSAIKERPKGVRTGASFGRKKKGLKGVFPFRGCGGATPLKEKKIIYGLN
jgi:hypothetical protein